MPIRFRARTPGEKAWRVINGTYLAILGTGGFIDAENGSVQITTTTSPRTSDECFFQVELTSDMFAAVAQALMDADPEQARKAFGRALVLGPREPIFDEEGRELG